MIHLTIQDIALLANLADCCNSVEEFVEHLNKTYGWGSTPLSARSDEDGEFVIDYGTIDSVYHGYSQDKRVGSVVGVQSSPSIPSNVLLQTVNTIKRLKLEGGPHYKFTQYSGTSQINHAPPRGDYLMALYAGVQQLKHNQVTDYRVHNISTILKLLIYRMEPFSAVYYTMSKLESSRDGDDNRAEFAIDTKTVIKTTFTRDIEPAVEYQTLHSATIGKHAEYNTSVQTVDYIRQPDPVDYNVSYRTVDQLKHERWNPNMMPVGYGTTYQSVKLIEHIRWEPDGAPVDKFVYNTTVKNTQHIRWNPSEMPVLYGTSYSTPTRIEHVRADKADAAMVDRGMSHVTPQKLQLIRWNPSEMPTLYGTSYATPTRIEHVRADRADAAMVDRGMSHVTPQKLQHIRWNPTEQLIGSGAAYSTMHNIEHTRSDESDAPVDRGAANITIGDIQFVRENPTEHPAGIANTVKTVHKIQNYQQLPDSHAVGIAKQNESIDSMLYNQPAGRTYALLGASNILYETVDLTKVYFAFDRVDYNVPLGDTKMYCIYTLSKVLYHAPDRTVNVHTMDRVLYDVPSGDTKTRSIQTFDLVKYNVPVGDTKNVVIQSIDKIEQPQTERIPSFTTIDKISTIDDVFNTSYQTISNISHVACSDAACDDTTLTWQTTCIHTNFDRSGLLRATYGSYRIRVVLFQNETEEVLKPETHRHVRVSDIRLIHRNNQVYNLSSHSVTASNCGGCFLPAPSATEGVDSNSMGQIFTGRLQTTIEQLSSGRDAGVVQGSPMSICFTLTSNEPITHVQVAPGGYNGEPRNTPGMVRVDCLSPGGKDWFTVSYGRTERKAIPGHTRHNAGERVWRVGEYMSFQILNNHELYQINHLDQMKLCT